MYILLNESGNVITCIPHEDQPVRQDNGFDLNICFPRQERFLNLSPFVEFSVGGKFILAGESDYSHWGLPAFVFHKTDVNEAIFEFKEGESYYRYRIHVPKESGVTSISGALPTVVSVVINDVTRQGRCTLNVLKTYGSDDRVGVEGDNLDTLMTEFKRATNLYTFDGQAMNGASLNNVFIYCWKTIGFVQGIVTLNSELSDMPDFDNEPGYTAVACFPNSVDLTVPSVFIGHSTDGDDVEFKIVGDGTPTDQTGTIYLLLNKKSDASPNEPLWVLGQFMATQMTLDFTQIDEQPLDQIVIRSVSATARDGLAADANVSLNRISNTDRFARNLAFQFTIPKGEQGDSAIVPDGVFALSVENGKLVAHYPDGQQDPNEYLSVNSAGKLVYNY